MLIGSPMRETRAKCRQPGVALLAGRQQSLDDEGAVDAGERHHVADRRQRHQVEHRQKVGLRGVRALDAQQPRRLHQRQEHHAGRAEMPLPGKIVLAVGIDHRDRHRQRPADLVVVEHDDFRAGKQCGIDRRRAVGAAVDGDDQLGAAAGQLAHRLGVGAVALEDAVGNVDFGLDAVMREKALQQRRGRSAVDIVVAEDRHLLAVADRLRKPLSRAIHVGQRGRIGQQVLDRRVEETLGLLRRHAAPGEHARDDVGHAMRLRDRQRGHLLALGQPVLPAEPGRRSLHAEKDALVRHYAARPPVMRRR